VDLGFLSLGLSEDLVVELCVEGEMGQQAVGTLGGAPGFADETTEVGPQHGGRMVEREERIAADSLELPLTYDAAPSALEGPVPGLGEVLGDPPGVVGLLIRLDEHVRAEVGFEVGEKLVGGAGAMIRARAVLFQGNLTERSLGGHHSHAESQDFSGLGLYQERDAEGEALGALKALHFVKLGFPDEMSAGLEVGPQLGPGLVGEEQKLSLDGLGVDLEEERDASLGDFRAKESVDGGVELPLLLPKAGGEGGAGEFPPAA
jgi:hypothetical protein